MDLLGQFLVLDPKGTVALAERGLMLHATLFMLIVAVPVFILTFFFAWWYRAGNTKALHLPDWEHGKLEELVWWAIPFEIILILGALTWSSTHALDPKKPLDSALGEPLVVQAVALDWKWLFIYPKEGIASVNYLQIPAGRPVRFEVTADAPMNAFWIPELGGMIYAMTGMATTLHLQASEEGKFRGGSANYSGEGFAHMKFIAEAVSPEEFDAWVSGVRDARVPLTGRVYEMLRAPSIEKEPSYYGRVEENLFNTIVMQFMDTVVREEKLPAEAFPHRPEAGAGSFSQH